MQRCVNLDWLECYCLEDALNYPHDARYFRERGWHVVERDYGTPMYREMFTLFDAYNEPLLEVRRAPKSDSQRGLGLFDHYSAHVRLCNRSCYLEGAARFLQSFLEEHGFAFQRISRVDVCLDFEKFDEGDLPQKFLQRYIAGKFSKINQARISAHGMDAWDGRAWNSVSWGAPSSMVRTRFYNKSLELAQVKDKPYIRQAWQAAGLVSDMHTLERTLPDGTSYKPEIWRVEFAVQSSTKGWFVVDDYNGDRHKLRSIRNTLDCYFSRQQLFDIFASLAHHYFHFKHVTYKNGKDGVREIERKDRCPDKVLFRKNEINSFYQLETVATAEPRRQPLDTLLLRLYAYRDTHYQDNVRQACNVLISFLESENRLRDFPSPLAGTELEILRRAIELHLKAKDVPVSTTLEQAKEMVQIEREIWEHPF